MPTPAPDTTPAPELVPAAAAAVTEAPTPAVADTAHPSRRRAVGDRLGRWRRGPDRPPVRAAGAVIMAVLLVITSLLLRLQDATQYSEVSAYAAYWWIVLVLAVAGLVIAAFEMPLRWPTTVLHLLSSVYFAVLPLMLFHLQTDYYSPSSDGSSAALDGTFFGGTIAYVIAAVGCGVAVLRRARDAVTITGLITAALAAVGTALIMVSEGRDPVNLSGPGCVILIVAAVSSLVMAFLLPRGWMRSRAAADR